MEGAVQGQAEIVAIMSQKRDQLEVGPCASVRLVGVKLHDLIEVGIVLQENPGVLTR